MTSPAPASSLLLHELADALSLSTGRAAVPVAVGETAAAYGAVAAHRGLTVVTVVGDVLAVCADVRRSDPMAPAVDVALRAAVEGHLAAGRVAAPLGSTRDPVTGLLGRAAFLEAAERYVAAAERGAPPAVV